MLGHGAYRVLTLVDHSAMLTVHTDKYGVFDCKPLQFIWCGRPGAEGAAQPRALPCAAPHAAHLTRAR